MLGVTLTGYIVTMLEFGGPKETLLLRLTASLWITSCSRFHMPSGLKLFLHTNREIVVLGLRDGLTVRELQKFLGIRLVMTLEHGHGAVDDYWKSDGGTGFLRPRDYGARTGMSLSRFKNISRALCFHDKSQVSVRNCLLYNN